MGKLTSKTFYGSKLGPNQAETPEGYHLCLNVPIARTGRQPYLESEALPENKWTSSDGNKIVYIHRLEEDVFAPTTLASFEGKPITDDHVFLDVKTCGVYQKGHIQNVRRGVGDESDCLLGDLLVHDIKLIDDIKSGRQKEVSCGYYSTLYTNKKGDICQGQIIGNHIAVVQKGRAGPKIAIKDSSIGGATVNLLDRVKNLIFSKGLDNLTDADLQGLPIKVQDQDPGIPSKEGGTNMDPNSQAIEKLTAAVTQLIGILTPTPAAAPAPAPAPAPAAAPTVPQADSAEPVLTMDSVQKLIKDTMEAVMKGETEVEDGEIDSLIKEGETEVIDSEEELTEEDKLQAKDSAVKILKSIRSKVSGVKDPAARKALVDSAAQIYGPIIKGTASNSQYLQLLGEAGSRTKVRDSAPKGVVNTGTVDLGKDIAKQYNLHSKVTKS